MKYKEIEYKYYANGVPLSAFNAVCKAYGAGTYTEASGFDHFYSSANKGDKSFCRHRVGPAFNQLTFKRKISDKNNIVRTERNIDLHAKVSREDVAGLVSEFGFEYNFSLFKSCFIYKYPTHTFVYYVCYNEDMKEIGRFLEIEMDEDSEHSSESAAVSELTKLEALFSELGVTPQHRLRNSLYEMYRKAD